jgi:hypothetical protein
MKLHRSKLVETVPTLIGVLLLLAVLVWRQSYVQEKEALSHLYLSASGGDLRSVEQLSQSRASHAQWLLAKLAQDQSATSDSRVAAIKALDNRPALDVEALGHLIRINQPFVVRHAAAEVLEHRSCDDACISATLHAIHPMWKGEPALEASGSMEDLYRTYDVHPDPTLTAKIDADLRGKTEQDYRNLLNINPCETQKILKQGYSAEPAFIEFVQSRISVC